MAVSRPVVVGVDGSTAALAAVRWAAVEAGRRGTGLVVFHAELCDDPDLLPHGKPPGDAELLMEPARRLLRQAAETARQAAPAVPVRMCVRLGTAAELLAALSDEAGLLALGAHGLGGARGGAIGSVALRAAASARCPVVVIRGSAAEDGPVVVGLDDSDGGERALAFAFDAAVSRGTGIEAVHAWHDGREGGLREQVAAWSRKHPVVPVRMHVVRVRSAARALPGISAGAQLIVAGARASGPLAGGLLGSTGYWLLAHASCPVAVAR